MQRRLLVIGLMILLVVGTIAPYITLQAQDTVTIQLSVPNFNRDAFSDQMIADFESANPGVKVNILKNDTGVPSVAGGLTAYFDAIQKYMSSADVLFIDPRRTPVSPAATQAGYFLDLAPLVAQDTAINVDDFFPNIWTSYQWDKGLWVLPNAADVMVMSYDPAAFQKAGIAEPSDKWTLDDLISATNKLTQKDAEGKVTVPGLSIAPASNVLPLFRSLLPEGLFDASAVPNTPKIDKPAVEAMLDAWSTQLDQAGLISGGFQEASVIPMSIGSISNLMFQRVNSGSSQRKIIMLPGGKAGLSVQGFAVSSGTQYPEQAYKLAAFLTTRGELANRSAISPARKSLVGKQTAGAGGQGGGPGGGPGGPRRNVTPEQQALIDQALANGIPYAEMRYMEYLQAALNKMKTDKLDAKGALQAVDAQAVQDQAAALDKKQSNVVAVATPIPVVALAPGKVAVKFGLSSFTSPLPNQDKWNKSIQDFVASDPQVGRIDLDTRPGFGGQISGFTDAYDCFYLSYNAVPNTDLGLLIALDSFLAADKSFDKDDVIGNVMAQLQRDNKTWAFPIIITPTILDYNSDQFNKAGVPAPTNGWTIDAFKDAMKTLKLSPQDPPPFIASNTAGAHLLILIAAYGGLPIDYRTNPVTINFTDPATVDAIRQVLDLAKQGYIKYDALSNFAFDNRIDRTADVYTDNLNSFNARQRTADPSKADPYKPTSYPKGKFTGVSYNIGTMYVSAKSQNPEACYRWISELSRHPDLFSAMPARRSLISDPAVVASQGQDVTALYNQIDELMKDTNVVAFPSVGGAGGAGITGFLMQHWLYQAFDSYVLKEGDLDSALKEAEGYAKGFQDCVANIPPFDPSTQNQRNYNQQFAECARKVDPNLKGLFGG
ncbi:MAG: hypothetical protein IT324_22840 [Anaerolineae bacterium]|nr:hypothetical protein [Anaerolineae bacterium]